MPEATPPTARWRRFLCWVGLHDWHISGESRVCPWCWRWDTA